MATHTYYIAESFFKFNRLESSAHNDTVCRLFTRWFGDDSVFISSIFHTTYLLKSSSKSSRLADLFHLLPSNDKPSSFQSTDGKSMNLIICDYPEFGTFYMNPYLLNSLNSFSFSFKHLWTTDSKVHFNYTKIVCWRPFSHNQFPLSTHFWWFFSSQLHR